MDSAALDGYRSQYVIRSRSLFESKNACLWKVLLVGMLASRFALTFAIDPPLQYLPASLRDALGQSLP
jgi:hypothetical protein